MQLHDLIYTVDSALPAAQLSTRHRAKGQSEPSRSTGTPPTTAKHAPVTYSKLGKRLRMARRLQLPAVTAILCTAAVVIGGVQECCQHQDSQQQSSSQKQAFETRFEMPDGQ